MVEDKFQENIDMTTRFDQKRRLSIHSRSNNQQRTGNPMIKDSDSHRASVPFPWRRIFCSVFLVAAAVALVAAVASSDAVGQRVELPTQGAFHSAPVQKIAPWVMEHTANGQQAEFFVLLADQADLSPAAAFSTKKKKGRYCTTCVR